MNTLAEVTVDKEGNQVQLNEWYYDERSNERTMYTKGQPISICETHIFNKNHECTKCPYVFVGFAANRHIQTDNGIFERLSGNELGRKIA